LFILHADHEQKLHQHIRNVAFHVIVFGDGAAIRALTVRCTARELKSAAHAHGKRSIRSSRIYQAVKTGETKLMGFGHRVYKL